MNNVFAADGIECYNANRLADPPLSEVGEKQADSVGAFFADESASALLRPVHCLWVSPHRRTLQTCQPTASALGLAPMVWPLCHELGGVYESYENNTRREGRGGLTRAEMSEGWPSYQLPDDVTEKGWYDVDLNCESTEHCRGRARDVVAAMREKASAVEGGLTESHVIVCHHDFKCAMFDALLHPDTEGGLIRWTFYNTSISAVDIYADGRVAVLMVNSTAHLPPALVAVPDLSKR